MNIDKLFASKAAVNLDLYRPGCYVFEDERLPSGEYYTSGSSLFVPNMYSFAFQTFGVNDDTVKACVDHAEEVVFKKIERLMFKYYTETMPSNKKSYAC